MTVLQIFVIKTKTKSETLSKRSLTDDLEIPFVRMLMVFHNKDSESLAMQIAQKMISKRLKHNFNDRVFDVKTGTIVEHTAAVSTNFYKVILLSSLDSKTELDVLIYEMISTNCRIQTFENVNNEDLQASNDIDVSFIFENEYICKNPSAFSGKISLLRSRVLRT